MKNQLSGRVPAGPSLRSAMVIANALALALALSACGKQDDGKTAGQQLDSALAKTEQAAPRRFCLALLTRIGTGVVAVAVGPRQPLRDQPFPEIVAV